VLFDYDHIYDGSASAAAASVLLADTADTAPARMSTATTSAVCGVGLIDGGVQLTHRAFHGASIVASGCEGLAIPSAHGTATASLLIGDAAPFRGAAPGARLYAADVYCGQPTGGAVDAIAAAFGWLHTNRVAVINISLSARII